MNAFDHGESELSEEEEDEIDRTAPDLIHSIVCHLTAWKTAQSLQWAGLRDIAFGDLPAHGRRAAADEGVSVRVRALIRAMLRCALSRPEGLEGEPFSSANARSGGPRFAACRKRWTRQSQPNFWNWRATP